jgi:hypothetical protein
MIEDGLAELHTQILLCQRAGWLSTKDTEVALGLADEIGRMITVLKRRWRQPTATKRAPGPPTG